MVFTTRRYALLALALGLTVQAPPHGAWTPGLEAIPDATEGGLDRDEILYKSGDVIFRRGLGMVSRAVLTADPESGFSHAGLVRRTEGETWVIHALTETPLTREAKIRAEPLDTFLGELSGALYRPSGNFAETGQRAAEVAYGYVLEGKTFDSHFDLETEDKLYCTELVWKAYLEAGLDLVDGEFDDVRIPMFHQRGIFPGRLLRSPYLQLVHQFSGKE